MTQEEKDLLFKDLCSRLPYSVKVQIIEVSDFTNEYLSPKIKTVDCLLLGKLSAIVKGYRKDEIKPYLFPMSKMTEKQFKEHWELEHSGDMEHLSIPALDWLNKNHFDYRGLIEKGLAIEVNNSNNPYKG